MTFIQADLAERNPGASPCQLVMANPPWLQPGAGRRPVGELRQKALCADESTLAVFCRAASCMLASRGSYCLILPPALIGAFFAAIAALPLGLREVLPVASHKGESASRLLLLARKDAVSAPELLPQLVLHESDCQGWTGEAIDFCPWLEADRTK